MDNFRFDITASGDLEDWLHCCIGENRKTVGWSVCSDREYPRLILYWIGPGNIENKYNLLPFPMKYDQVAMFVKGWLDTVDFGTQPDHDGDNSRGWRIYNEDWGHVDGQYQAFMAITPVWAMHGK